MRKMVTLCLTLLLVLSPVAGMIAVAFGASGDHAHYDHVWHAVDIDQHADHERGGIAHHGHEGAPPNHSHADHIHLAVFMPSYTETAAGPQIAQSHTPRVDAALFGRRSYPPFRPPQSL